MTNTYTLRAYLDESWLQQEQVMRQRFSDRLKILGIDTDLYEE